jgi:hypothetical protein
LKVSPLHQPHRTIWTLGRNPYVLSGILSLTSVIYFEVFLLKKNIFLEGTPDFTASSILCSIGLFLSVIAISWGLFTLKDFQNTPQLSLMNSRIVSFENSVVLGIILTAFISLIIFIASPTTFNQLSKEDNLVEWSSSIFAFMSCLFSIACLVRCQYFLYVPKITKLTVLFFAIIFFLISMEEISWFQRVFEIKTPELLIGNLRNEQNEFNLHNVATNKTENVYYISAFLFLVMCPFLRSVFPFITLNNYINFFTPRSLTIIPGAIGAAYNYNMWDNPFMQVTFFGSTITLLLFALFCKKRTDKVIAIFTLLLIVITQVVFLTYGSRFIRNWDVTEYKELFIPLGFFLYSLSLFHTSKKLYQSK